MSLDLLPLLPLAFFAGFVDAVVGGGGLVQLPALFTVYPQATPSLLFGTNKLSSIFGTAAATARYARGLPLPWRMLGPAAFAAFVCAFLGARAVSHLPVAVIRPVVLVLLVGVAVYTFARKDLGSTHAPRLSKALAPIAGLGIGAVLGFYDGFFGPGTGAFLIFAFVRIMGFDFVNASASAKVVNTTTNLAALLYFVPSGNVLWLTGLLMAVSNVLGSLLGSSMALRRGTGFVRRVFLVVVAVMTVKFGYDTLWPRHTVAGPSLGATPQP